MTDQRNSRGSTMPKLTRFGVSRYQGRVVAYVFMCPGCQHIHQIFTNDSKSNVKWDTKGDENSLVVSPSLLVWSGEENGRKLGVCHSFIKGTHIEFLGDCSAHNLRGLVEIPVRDWSNYGGLDND